LHKFTFIDLFAGIGGFRIGLEAVGGKCIFSCERDRFCVKTYEAWFGDTPAGDIREVDAGNIPQCDVLCGGFPCPSFSKAGVSQRKGAGRQHGFKDPNVGDLFFEVMRLVNKVEPPVVFLENVSDLVRHNQGRTFQIIKQEFLEVAGYNVFHKLINAKHYVPQSRERIFIVSLSRKVFGDIQFLFPEEPQVNPKLSDILEDSVDQKFTLTKRQWDYQQNRKQRNKELGKGFGYRLASPDGISSTLPARYYKDGSDILVKQGTANPRKLTPKECARLMGFPDRLPIVVSNTQAYKQFGNAVVPTIISAIGANIVHLLSKLP
jgi:DNA (cytosine-5)-methyltransferase 1